MAARPDEFVVDFPTLWVGADWVERHCVVPDGFRRGAPFELYDWQLWCHVNHYRVKPTVKWRPENPVLAPAFVNRRSLIIAPQKTGKGPWTASEIALEGAGPALFGGWAGKDDGYVCADHGCGCGWEYAYRPGEPMGMRWPTPLIQLTAVAEDQTDNVYRPLQTMIKLGPLADLMRVGESFIRVGEEGRIDVVTSSAQTRLGNPVTFVLQDETGLWTDTNKMVKVADTQRRGLAGMGGRSMETTNCFDPTERSQAQLTYQGRSTDIFRFHRPPPAHLSYTNKQERHRIHVYVYRGSKHVDLDAIEGEAAELIDKGDAAQAERFFGNRIVAGSGTWCDAAKWKARAQPREVPKGTAVVLGMDGSDTDDWTAIRAQTRDGYQFTPRYGPLNLPTIWNPSDWDGQVPRLEVRAAVKQIFADFVVVRWYIDPPYWTTEADDWAAEYGEKVVIRWPTARATIMQAAADRLKTDMSKVDSTFTHDGDATIHAHVEATHKAPRPGGRYVLCKPEDGRKIDGCIASILTDEAAGDVTAAGLWPKPRNRTMFVYR